MPGSSPSFSALFIIEKSIISSAAVSAWLGSGNLIKEFWTSDRRLLEPDAYDILEATLGGFATVKTFARQHDIPIRKIEKLSKSQMLLKAAQQLGADALVTVYTYQIVPADMIKLFNHRTLNIHPAFLPHYKGPQPRKSLLADGFGEAYGGITLHAISHGIDEGDIIAQRHIPHLDGELTGRWKALAANAVTQMMRDEAMQYLRGCLAATPQVAGSSNYRKVSKNEFFFTADKTFDEAAHLARVLAPDDLAWIPERKDALARKRYRVGVAIRNIGKPTGKPPIVKSRKIEADLLDCRLSMPRLRFDRKILYRIESGLQIRPVLSAGKTFKTLANPIPDA